MRYFTQRNSKIKKLLRTKFPKVSVKGQTGTAFGWINIHLGLPHHNPEAREQAITLARKMIHEAEEKKEFELSYYWDDFNDKRAEMLISAGSYF